MERGKLFFSGEIVGEGGGAPTGCCRTAGRKPGGFHGKVDQGSLSVTREFGQGSACMIEEFEAFVDTW